MKGTWTSVWNPSTDAQFRAVLSPVSAALLASGWTLAYTNINWSTVLKPTTANTVAGKEIWAMGDALQATAPKFLQIEYGTGVDATTVRLMLGTGTGQSAGTLTGQVTGPYYISPGSFPGSFTHRWCGSNNFFILMFCVDAGNNNYQGGFSIERDHATTGADTGNGLLLLYYYYTSAGSAYIPTSGLIPNAMSHWNSTAPPSGTGAVGANIYLFPVRAWAFSETCASLCFFNHFTADLTANNPTPCTLWDGNAHTIITNGASLSSNTAMFYGGTTAPVMRWE